MKSSVHTPLSLVACVTILLAGCATPFRDTVVTQSRVAQAVVSPTPAEVALEDRILALDPQHITPADVKTLAAGPTPRIVLMHGGIYPVHLAMESFGHFLTGMGYPEAKIRDPGDGEWSYSPYVDSQRIAGLIAWQYERDGMRPMMIGHSQGGIQTIKVLRELAGLMSPSIPVFDPVQGREETRTSIVDPLTGKERPVVGLKVSYASGVAAGGAALLLPNQWNMVGKVRSVPDSVEDFTGYTIGLDLWAWTLAGDEGNLFRPNGTAHVRNLDLPAYYNHVMVPYTGGLPDDPQVRAWIEAYEPGGSTDVSQLPGEAQAHVLWAADVWYSVKKHWCLEAQRLIRVRRAATLQARGAGAG